MSALRALKTAAGAACHRACRRRGSTASRAPASVWAAQHSLLPAVFTPPEKKFLNSFTLKDEFAAYILAIMAKTGFVEIPTELKPYFDKIAQWNNRYYYGGVRKKSGIIPEKKKYDVPSRSFLPQVSALWAGLSGPEREAWITAGSQTNINGWNLFVQDTCYRLKYGHEGLATPSNYHQYKVGRMQIEAPSDRLVISQTHPIQWYKLKKITGTKAQYQEVVVNEQLMLPLNLALSFRSDLVATTAEPTAKFYAKVISHYQGRDIETEVGFDIDLESDWQRKEETLTNVLGIARWYSLFIELDNVRGFIEFDNVESRHSGTNYARDFRCIDINAPLSRTFFQVTKSWIAIDQPTNTFFESVYPSD